MHLLNAPDTNFLECGCIIREGVTTQHEFAPLSDPLERAQAALGKVLEILEKTARGSQHREVQVRAGELRLGKQDRASSTSACWEESEGAAADSWTRTRSSCSQHCNQGWPDPRVVSRPGTEVHVSVLFPRWAHVTYLSDSSGPGQSERILIKIRLLSNDIIYEGVVSKPHSCHLLSACYVPDTLYP